MDSDEERDSLRKRSLHDHREHTWARTGRAIRLNHHSCDLCSAVPSPTPSSGLRFLWHLTMVTTGPEEVLVCFLCDVALESDIKRKEIP